MRTVLLLVWLLVPIGVLAYHFGPGQSQIKLDKAAGFVSDARAAALAENWAEAQTKFELALKEVPVEDTTLQRQLRLEICKAQMLNRQLPVAHQSLTELMEEVSAGNDASAKLRDDIREALGNSQYYLTWLLRLEGQPRERWEPEIEAARQNFRILAEQSDETGNVELTRTRKENLEAAVRLARMDLGELQGLPLPSQ